MSQNLPDRRKLEAALDVLRKWRADAIRSYAQTTNDEMRSVYRQRATDADYLAFRLQQMLHPASQPNTDNNEKNGDQG